MPKPTKPALASPPSLAENSRGPLLIAAFVLLLHALTNARYGFHRDELQTLDDARHLAWGFVTYPPLTPFFGRISLMLFGISVAGARVFPAIAQGVAILCGGWMARELGGRRFAQCAAALAVACSPVSIVAGALLQYVSFDFLWWLLVALFVLRMLRTGDARYWMAIGAAVGLGVMTKYSMLFLVAALLVALAVTSARSFLATRWMWAGIGIALLIVLPNAIWQIQHQFISLEFLKHIHARDVRMGRTSGFFGDQFTICANPFTVPLWIAGLFFYLRSQRGRQFRVIGWMFLFTMGIFIAAQGRGYYSAPLYPMLLAAGAVAFESWVEGAETWKRVLRYGSVGIWIVSGALTAAAVLPIVPMDKPYAQKLLRNNGNLAEEIGWQELTQEVAHIYNAIPQERRAHTGILATNYGEAGAINLYGPKLGLPQAISGTNTMWLRGYPDPPPDTLIVVGLNRDYADAYFSHCILAGRNGNRYGVHNEESDSHPDIFLCDGMRTSWAEFWKHFRLFG